MILPVLTPGDATLLLSLLCGFLLKVTLGYGLGLLVARVATSAATRFLVWLTFLLASTTYWIWCVARAVTLLLAPLAAETQVIQAAHHAHASRLGQALAVTLSVEAAGEAGKVLAVAGTVYLVALLLLAVVEARNRLQLAHALRYRVVPQASLAKAFEQILVELQAPACKLWLLPGLRSPASLGWMRPAIYLPVDVVAGGVTLCSDSGLSSDVEDVLCHELSHVQRRDGLWETLARVCRWLVFFHPLVSSAFAALRLERELACDRLVVRRHPEQRDLYADTLVRFGWKTSIGNEPDHIGIGFTSQAAILNARVRSILQGERVYSRTSSVSRALLGTAACWGFWAAAPALWVGFLLVGTAPATAPFSSLSRLNVVRPGKRQARAMMQQRKDPPANAANVADALPGPVSRTDSSGSREQGFRAQNEDEPMSNPVRDADLRGVEATGPAGADVPGQPSVSSTTSVVVDTATQLERMGLARVHDNDHDHD